MKHNISLVPGVEEIGIYKQQWRVNETEPFEILGQEDVDKNIAQFDLHAKVAENLMRH